MFNKSSNSNVPTHFLYVVRDAVGDTFNTPFVQRNANEAIRGFTVEVNTPREGNMFNTHSNDFALYEVGSYDHRTGIVTAYDVPKLVAQAASLKELAPVQPQFAA